MNLIKKITLLSYISVASTESAILTPAFPQIQQVFHISTGQLSLLMTVFLVGYLLCQLAFGPLANRFGRLTLMRMGFVLNVLSIGVAILGARMHQYDLLLWSRLFTALGAGVGLSGTFTLIHEWMDEQEAKGALSMAVLSFMLGIGLGIYVGGWLTQTFGWESVLYVSLIYAVIMLGSTFLFQQSAFTAQPIYLKAILTGYRHSLTRLKLVRYSYVFGYGTTISYLYSAAAPLISTQFLHLSVGEYGRWNLVIMLGMLLGSLHSKRLARRYSMRRIILIGLIGGAVAIGLWALLFCLNWSSVILFFVGAALAYYAMGFVFAGASFLAMEGAQDKNSASGMMNFINMSTAAIGLLTFGYLPMTLLFNFLTVLIAGGVVAFLFYNVS